MNKKYQPFFQTSIDKSQITQTVDENEVKLNTEAMSICCSKCEYKTDTQGNMDHHQKSSHPVATK